jgi:hypothetical protein
MKAKLIGSAAVAAAVLLGSAPRLQAHCDTLNGPVVIDARAALAKGEPGLVLKWVGAEQEPEIRAAFAQALAVRKLSPEAAALADRWFFETLVRVHRAGEGAPFTGLKDEPELEPGVGEADRALASGDVAPLLHEAGERVNAGLRARFERVRAAQAHKDHGVEAGRAYVEAYVDYVHYAERVFAATGGVSGEQAEHHAGGEAHVH